MSRPSLVLELMRWTDHTSLQIPQNQLRYFPVEDLGTRPPVVRRPGAPHHRRAASNPSIPSRPPRMHRRHQQQPMDPNFLMPPTATPFQPRPRLRATSATTLRPPTAAPTNSNDYAFSNYFNTPSSQFLTPPPHPFTTQPFPGAGAHHRSRSTGAIPTSTSQFPFVFHGAGGGGQLAQHQFAPLQAQTHASSSLASPHKFDLQDPSWWWSMPTSPQ